MRVWGRGRLGRVALLCGALLTGLLTVLLTVAAAGTITKPGTGAAVKTKGLTAAERRALKIVSVQATGVEPTGLTVTVTFAGNVEQALGRGNLKSAVVALILRPRKAGLATADVATVGAGRIGTTLRKTRSTQVGILRKGRQLFFFVAGPGFANVGKIDVKAFAVGPSPGGKRSIQAAGVSPAYWEELEVRIAANELNFDAPNADTDCRELGAWQRLVATNLADARKIGRELDELGRKIDKALADRTSTAQEFKDAYVIFVDTFLVPFIENPKTRIDTIEEAKRSLKRDRKLVDDLITKNQDLIEKLLEFQGKLKGLFAAKCNATSTPPPPPTPVLLGITPIKAVFVPGELATEYSVEVTQNVLQGPPTYRWQIDLEQVDPAGSSPPGYQGTDPKAPNYAVAGLDPSCTNAKLAGGEMTAPNEYIWTNQDNTFTWYHGDKGVYPGTTYGCDHTKMGPSGHQAKVTVTVKAGLWTCVATIKGSNLSPFEVFGRAASCSY